MDTTRIIRGTINSMGCTVTSAITQWDYGWQFIPEIEDLPPTYRLDFSNEEKHGTALPVYCSTDGAEVPTELIDTGKDVWVWFVRIGDGFGKSEYKWRIPNKCKPKTEQDEPSPSQQSSIDQLITRSNEAVETAEQKAEEADQSARSAQGYAEQAETAKSDAQTYANNASASATSASQSATASANSATASAQSASQSAQIKSDVESLVDDAQGYADSASQSATASATSASQAQGFAQSASASAQSASGYASSAQTSANTASAKAQDASTSASTASQKATEASQSASQALTYKNDAESAKTASQTAQTASESARDSAIQAKTDAESAKADAETARDEAQQAVASISGALAEKAPVITDTASGAIASFPDGADGISLKSLVVDIDPVQDLSNGDPSPENICPISGWTGCNLNHAKANLFDNDTTKIHAVTHGTANEGEYVTRYGYEIYLPAGTYTIRAERDPSLTESHYIYGGVYKKSGSHDLVTTANIWVNKTGYTRTITVEEDECILYFNAVSSTSLNDAKTSFSYFDITMWVGTEVGEYAPYHGQSIPILWETEAGTVYAGSLDVLSGVLTVEMAMVDLGTLPWSVNTTGVRFYATSNSTDFPYKMGMATKMLCSVYKYDGYGTTARGYYGDNGTFRYAYTTAAVTREIYIHDDSKQGMTGEEFKAAMNGVQLCYELATPIEIQLTPNQVNSLLGVNNIWADSGDTEVEYRADTKLYINKKIAEAISALS